jgi:hypothetical protein
MGGIATTTGVGMDAMVGLAIIVGLVVLATMVGLVVLATMVGLVVLAIIAERLTLSGLDALKTRERNRLRVLRTF